MGEIPADRRGLFDLKTFAHFSTVMPDGTPQVTPVWVDHDADANRVLVNTARGRRKERNVRRNPKVGLSMTHPADPYRFLSVRGEVTDLREDSAAQSAANSASGERSDPRVGAVEHINRPARR